MSQEPYSQQSPESPQREPSRAGTAGAALRIPVWAVVVLVAGVVGQLLWERCGLRGCPNVERLAAFQPGGAAVLLDRHGEPFADLRPMRRELIPLDSLPDHVLDAFVAIEDRRFYEHRGVDWRRVGGAALADIRAGGIVEGSSTITMQLARNVFPDRLPGRQRTFRRKLLEVRVTRDIERRFTKPEILELYLNHIYFGAGVYGIEAAAQHYFRRPASGLDLPRAALLAALPKGPNIYDPRRAPDLARERRDLVLRMMAEQERIGEDEHRRAARAALGVSRTPPPPQRPDRVAPYFVQLVRRQLEARFGDELYASALRIHTTLDRGVQRAAEEELERQLRAIEHGSYGRFDGARYVRAASNDDDDATPYLQGVVVVLDAHEGDILALVGGRDFEHSAFNRATRARRQAGSAFKPFVYAAAIDGGYAPSQHVADEPLRLELAGGEVWEPRNLDGRFEGSVTLREALTRSRNVPTVRVGSAVGMRRVAHLARRTGMSGPIPDLPSVAIGAAAVTPLELFAAYSAFATLGEAVQPRFVTRVEGAEGQKVWDARARKRRVLSPATAYVLNDILADAVERGTGRAVRNAGFRAPAAGKTGTTNDATDVWFVGYTPDLVGGVWIGFDRPRRIADNATAGTLAAPLWGHLMRRVYADRPAPEPWQPPRGVVVRQVDPQSGLVLTEGCRPRAGRAYDEVFLARHEPASVCPEGEPAGGPGFFARIGAFAGGILATVRDWLGDRLARDRDAPEPEQRDDYLGAPRLPRAAEQRAAPREPRSRDIELLGVPLDSVDIDEPDEEEPPVPEPGDTVLLLRPDEDGPVLDTVVVLPRP